MTDADFTDDYETDPPTPIQGSERVSNYDTDLDAVPDDFVDDEHVATVGDWTVMRAGFECPECGSNVFFHPESIVPRNTVDCFNCRWAPFGLVWWETPRLESFDQGAES